MLKYKAVAQAIEEMEWTSPDTQLYMELVYQEVGPYRMFYTIINRMKEEGLAVDEEVMDDVQTFVERVFELIEL